MLRFERPASCMRDYYKSEIRTALELAVEVRSTMVYNNLNAVLVEAANALNGAWFTQIVWAAMEHEDKDYEIRMALWIRLLAIEDYIADTDCAAILKEVAMHIIQLHIEEREETNK